MGPYNDNLIITYRNHIQVIYRLKTYNTNFENPYRDVPIIAQFWGPYTNVVIISLFLIASAENHNTADFTTYW